MFGAFADDDDAVGFFQGLTELPLVDLRVYPVVVFRMTQKDEVVDGDNAFDTTLTESDGQFARETVVDLYTVTPEVFDDTVGAPEGRPSLTPPVEGENRYGGLTVR